MDLPLLPGGGAPGDRQQQPGHGDRAPQPGDQVLGDVQDHRAQQRHQLAPDPAEIRVLATWVAGEESAP